MLHELLRILSWNCLLFIAYRSHFTESGWERGGGRREGEEGGSWGKEKNKNRHKEINTN